MVGIISYIIMSVSRLYRLTTEIPIPPTDRTMNAIISPKNARISIQQSPNTPPPLFPRNYLYF